LHDRRGLAKAFARVRRAGMTRATDALIIC